MIRLAMLPPGLTKEVRALLPVWLACMLAVGAGAFSADPRVFMLGLAAYGLGSIALGANSIGHEYTHRTLGLILSQPLDRRRLYLMKTGVLAAMLIALAAMAWAVLVGDSELVPRSIWREPGLLFLATLCGLFVAPWLTMICRSTLAGVVFTFVTPVSLLILGDLVGVAKYGVGGGARIDSFKLSVLWWGTFAICAIAAVWSWRMFMRLEAIDGRGPEVHVPRWLPRVAMRAERIDVARRSRRHPVWLLARKELRLQQMTFVVVGLYILGWTAVSLLEYLAPELPALPVGPLTMLYFGLLAILIGSLASAEERQFGTLEWQTLLPMPSWQQWAVKVAIALGLAILLGTGLPSALRYINNSANDFRDPLQVWPAVTMTVVLLTTCSLYVSSLSTSGVRALVLSLPVIIGALMFVQLMNSAVSWAASHMFFDSGIWTMQRPLRGAQVRAYLAAENAVTLTVAAALTVLLLRLAFVNHRSAERSSTRVWRQALTIAGALTLGVVLLSGVWLFYLTR